MGGGGRRGPPLGGGGGELWAHLHHRLGCLEKNQPSMIHYMFPAEPLRWQPSEQKDPSNSENSLPPWQPIRNFDAWSKCSQWRGEGMRDGLLAALVHVKGSVWGSGVRFVFVNLVLPCGVSFTLRGHFDTVHSLYSLCGFLPTFHVCLSSAQYKLSQPHIHSIQLQKIIAHPFWNTTEAVNELRFTISVGFTDR